MARDMADFKVIFSVILFVLAFGFANLK
ncbi:unnamed protein product [Camellia sinensis]